MSQIGCVVEGTIAPKSNYSATSMLIAIASCSPRLTQPPISSVHSREEWIGIKEIAHDRLEHKKRMKRERIDTLENNLMFCVYEGENQTTTRVENGKKMGHNFKRQ